MIDLHRHDEYSVFDGFGKAEELAQIAFDLGHTCFSTANHGNTNGLVQHYYACKKVGIKPILGVEAYFKPKLDDVRKSYHLCLFCKDLKGYENLNQIMTIAEKQKYYNPIVTLKELRKYSDGLICTSACIASVFSQYILDKQLNKCKKALLAFKKIFGDDFYIELQPYKIDDRRTQEKVNEQLMLFGKQLDIKTVLTSDSHYGKKGDFESYKKMHEIAKHNMDIENTYKERYIPSEEEILKRFTDLHSAFVSSNLDMDCNAYSAILSSNMDDIGAKVDADILDKVKPLLPVFDENRDSFATLTLKAKQGLKDRKKWNRKYWERCKEELNVINKLGFSDYFLIVQDYVNFAKNNKIAVGAGRGSGCNSLVNYALKITEVDSIYFKLDFRRFLREDKKKMPKQYWAFNVNVLTVYTI